MDEVKLLNLLVNEISKEQSKLVIDYLEWLMEDEKQRVSCWEEAIRLTRKKFRVK